MNYSDFFMPNNNITPSMYAANVEAAARDEYFDTMGGLGLCKTPEAAWKRFATGSGIINDPTPEIINIIKDMLPPVSDEFIMNIVNCEYVSNASVLPILYIVKVLNDNGIDASLLAFDSATVVAFCMLGGINISESFSKGTDMAKNKQPLFLQVKNCKHKGFIDGVHDIFNKRAINGFIANDNSIMYIKLAPYKDFECLRNLIKMITRVL